MSNRDFAKIQIDVLPDSAVDKVIEFMSFQLYSLGITTDGTNALQTTHRPVESDQKVSSTWDKLDEVISHMDILPDFADFSRCDNERKLIDFAEVK